MYTSSRHPGLGKHSNLVKINKIIDGCLILQSGEFYWLLPPVERGSSLLYTGLSYSLYMCWKCLNRPQKFTLLIWIFCIQLFILFVIANFKTSYYVFCSMLSLSLFSTLPLEIKYQFLHVHSTLHPSDTLILIWENARFFQLEKLNYNFNDYFSLIMDYILCGHLYNIRIDTIRHKNLQKFTCSSLAPTQ